MTTTIQKRRNQKIRAHARAAVRRAHPEEFRALHAIEKLVPGRCHQAAHNAAEGKLAALYPEERRAAHEAARESFGWPKGHGGGRPKGHVNLRKTIAGVRRDIDPIDALILFDRYMTVPQIAEYDNCTQTAVQKTLVPLLRQRGMTDRAIAERLDIWALQVAQVA